MIRLARRRCRVIGNASFRRTSGLDLRGFDEGSFDLVLAVDSFPYLVLAGLAERHMAEVARVLKTPGDAVLLNYSYSGMPELDRREVARIAAAHGLRVAIDGTAPFTRWDGTAFHLVKAKPR
jgi:hypothetical protein